MSFGRSGKDDKETVSGSTDVSSSSTTVGTFGSNKLEAFLGKGSKVVGNLQFTGPVEIDGYVEGEVNAQDRLTIGESAVLNARVVGGEVIIRGTVNGDVVATKKLSLKKPAKILGNISSNNLSIEEGVIFEGKCVMNGSGISSEKNNSGLKTASIAKVGAGS